MAAEDVAAAGAEPSELEGGGLLHEIFTSPLNLLLLGLCVFLLYKIVRGDQPATSGDSDDDEPPPLPRLKRRDFTPAELRRFDGVQDPRILMAINGKVFDVTKGRKFYGPGNGSRPRGRGDKRRGPGPRLGPGEAKGSEGPPRGGMAVVAGRLPVAVAKGRSRRAAAVGGRRRRWGGGGGRRLERSGGVGGGCRAAGAIANPERGHRRAQCSRSFEGMGFGAFWKEGQCRAGEEKQGCLKGSQREGEVQRRRRCGGRPRRRRERQRCIVKVREMGRGGGTGGGSKPRACWRLMCVCVSRVRGSPGVCVCARARLECGMCQVCVWHVFGMCVRAPRVADQKAGR